jgi:hypothetical protein
MSRDRWQMTLLRPPAVPVHHERDVPGDRSLRHTLRISFSFAAPISSHWRM